MTEKAGDRYTQRPLSVREFHNKPCPGGAVLVPVEDLELRPSRAQCLAARERARALRMPHNMARKRFVTDLLDALVRDQVVRLERPLDA